MKIKDAIAWADEVKPNAFAERVKFEWLNALEGKIAADLFLLAPAEVRTLHSVYPEALEPELLVGPPHDDIYTLYLQAKIDEANGEYNKYSNTMQIYNEYYGTFLRWFCGQYDPAQGYISEEARARDGTV